MAVPKTIELAGVEVPRIGLGTNRLTPTAQNVALLHAGLEAGLRHIDTAHGYTSGDSEEAIGAALAPFRPDLVVATKGGYGGAGHGRPEALRAEIALSLRRLQTDRIPLWYLHRVDPETPIEESLGAVAEFVERGAIGHVGLSAVGIAEIERAQSVVPIAAVQNHYNLEHRDGEDVIDYCAANGIVFVPYFPLRAATPALTEIAQRHGATPSQVTLAWLLHRSPATLPIPGTLSLSHLQENLAALDLELTDDDLALLAAG